jgi:hypothetical protein
MERRPSPFAFDLVAAEVQEELDLLVEAREYQSASTPA